jgi:hypothetical protein
MQEPAARFHVLGLGRILARLVEGLADGRTMVGQRVGGAGVVGFDEGVQVIQVGHALGGRVGGIKGECAGGQSQDQRQGKLAQEGQMHELLLIGKHSY